MAIAAGGDYSRGRVLYCDKHVDSGVFMLFGQDITGDARWDLAREAVARLRTIPAEQAEANIQGLLFSILGFLFPNLSQSELTLERESGDGPIDVYCRNVVFETKRPGKLDARRKPDGTLETPEEQAVRYLNALTAQPNMFADAAVGWRAGVTDGKEWLFYEYNRDAPDGEKLTLARALRLDALEDDDRLLSYLYDFVNRTVKLLPPTNNVTWAEQLVQPFIELAARYESRSEYEVKHQLWEGVLRGAFIIPPDDSESKRELFARHTMLVVIARAIAETFNTPERVIAREQLYRTLTEGFAAWLIDAADDEGAAAIDALVAEVNSYAWSAANRDMLKDLYHAVISRDIRHDFGEYYTPDWLARAVCEEVLDADWRQEVINMAVYGQLNGPAVLDPSCGAGTFLFHATQLLLEDARQHPELAQSPHAQVEIVNELVAGIDLHPVAVELSKTTKMLAFGDLAHLYAGFARYETIYLGDSLQWETRRGLGTGELGGTIDIPTVESEDPIRLPVAILTLEWFPQLLALVFSYANRPETPDSEKELLAVLGLSNQSDRESVLALYRRFREYIASGRNNVWQWYVANLIQPMRLSEAPVSRLVGNPPWVVYNTMSGDRQDAFRQRATDRGLWAGANLATQNDLAATFVATCVDYYLQAGGKFGFVLPYAALRARHWEPFRSGDWSLPPDAGRNRTIVDLSEDAWDLFAINSPPFPQANSSVIYGTRIEVGNSTNRAVPRPISGILAASNSESVNTGMAWDKVKPMLQWNRRQEWPVAPSSTYGNAFRNGATLFPQPLVVFEKPDSRARGIVYFSTNGGKGKWRGKERTAEIVEERFVKPALFSRLLLPFGATGHAHIIAPFSEDGSSLEGAPPQGDNSTLFRAYWDRANHDWRANSTGRPPYTLLDQINYQGKLSSQLGRSNYENRVVYRKSGSWLESSVVDAALMIDGTLYWYASSSADELHFLAALFNADALSVFFNVAGRVSDRDFHTGPIRNLPIPAYDAGNEHHANLAAQSQLAHDRVAALVAERQASGRRINRNDVLRDGAMQPILASIDESVRAILPDYCS